MLTYPVAFVSTFILGGPLGEEPGWRGFALPRLQPLHGPLVGSIILGILWALWHLPLFWSGVWTPPTIPNIVMFILMITALTIIMTWVFNNAKGSLLITMLMHASFNTFADHIVVPAFPAAILNEYPLLPELIGFGLGAVVIVALTRGRLSYRTLPRIRRRNGRAGGGYSSLGGTYRRDVLTRVKYASTTCLACGCAIENANAKPSGRGALPR